jgi:hypothetical protein
MNPVQLPAGLSPTCLDFVRAMIPFGLAATLVTTALFLAGYGFTRGWLRSIHADGTMTVIITVAVVLSAWPVVLLWSSLVNARWDSMRTASLLGLCATWGFLNLIRDLRRFRIPDLVAAPNWPWTVAFWAIVAGGTIFRLITTGSFVMLPGSDAYHHTLIVQLMLDQAGIPHNYYPYYNLDTFSYHFGFHSIAALVSWLLGSDPLTSTKITAVLLNAASAATVGLMAERFIGHRRAAVVAATVVAVISVSPYALLRWSRFTQTAGLFIMPAALTALTYSPLRSNRFLASILIAGLGLTHIRVAGYLSVFALILAIMYAIRKQWIALRGLLTSYILALLMVVPWFWYILPVQYGTELFKGKYLAQPGYNDIGRLEEPVIKFITNWPIIVISTFGIVVGFIKSESRVSTALLTVWLAALFGGSLLSARVGFSLWDVKTTLLSLVVPVAVFAAQAFHGTTQSCERTVGKLLWPAMLAVFVGLAAVGTISLPYVIHSALPDVTPTSLRTMEWIKNNTPQRSVFVSDAIEFDWAPGWIVGIGPGYWIPLLTGRASVVPPMIYPLEASNPLVTSDLQLVRRIIKSTPDMPVSRLISDSRVTHVFTTDRSPILPPARLVQDGGLRPVYHQDGMWVFEVLSR